ncbi:MAG: hypothetical protein ACJ77V_06475 [Chloroflexota bacterium]|jgi:hypothetical protein
MAHAGTPTDLAKQPTTSAGGIWQAIIAAVLVLAMVAAIVAVSLNLAGKASIVPAAEHGNQVQNVPAVNIHKVVGHKGALIYQ